MAPAFRARPRVGEPARPSVLTRCSTARRGSTALPYGRWLDANAVRFVVLPSVPLECWGRKEGRLAAGGLPDPPAGSGRRAPGRCSASTDAQSLTRGPAVRARLTHDTVSFVGNRCRRRRGSRPVHPALAGHGRTRLRRPRRGRHDTRPRGDALLGGAQGHADPRGALPAVSRLRARVVDIDPRCQGDGSRFSLHGPTVALGPPDVEDCRRGDHPRDTDDDTGHDARDEVHAKPNAAEAHENTQTTAASSAAVRRRPRSAGRNTIRTTPAATVAFCAWPLGKL